MRHLLGVWMVIAMMLAACGDGSAAASEPATADNGGAAESGAAEVGCAAAFDDLTAEDVVETVEGDGEELDRTIMACDTVEEWQTYFTQVTGGEVSAADQLTFIEGRCRANPELANVNACPDARES